MAALSELTRNIGRLNVPAQAGSRVGPHSELMDALTVAWKHAEDCGLDTQAYFLNAAFAGGELLRNPANHLAAAALVDSVIAEGRFDTNSGSVLSVVARFNQDAISAQHPTQPMPFHTTSMASHRTAVAIRKRITEVGAREHPQLLQILSACISDTQEQHVENLIRKRAARERGE